MLPTGAARHAGAKSDLTGSHGGDVGRHVARAEASQWARRWSVRAHARRNSHCAPTEVGITYTHMDRRIMRVLLVGMAVTKAAFVALYYMHLKYEKRSLLWLAFIPLPLAGAYAVFLLLDAQNLLRGVSIPWLKLHA